jgi:hypothetical protein
MNGWFFPRVMVKKQLIIGVGPFEKHIGYYCRLVHPSWKQKAQRFGNSGPQP